MRRLAARRLSGTANVHILEQFPPPPEVRLDLILVNSVVQYMAEEELAGWLGQLGRLLTATGRLVMSDLIPPGHRSLWDILSLLSFSLRRGYCCRAVRNVLGERKRYQQTVRAHPLLQVGPERLGCLAGRPGWTWFSCRAILTHFSRRCTAVLGVARPTENGQAPCQTSSERTT